jgi:hypothetical protein
VAAWVTIIIELVIALVALGRISTFSGVKLQDAWSGRPEQLSVTNIGAVSALLFTGVTEAINDPDSPGTRDFVAGAMDIPKLGVVVASVCAVAASEVERRCVGSPV